jgi:hypothetical protein
MTIEIIRELCTKKALYWTNHADSRIAERDITRDDILNVLMTGEIIEQYQDDQPYPSCLVLGITAYYPSLEQWTVDYKTRIGGK